MAEQVTGAIQHGYGELTEGAHTLTYATPGTFDDVIDRGRDLVRRADGALRERFGDASPTYVLVGAVAFLAASIFCAGRR